MKILMVAVLWLLFASGAGVPTYAQSTELERLNDEVNTLYKQGQYDRALVAARRALQVTEQAVGSNHPQVVLSLDNLAMVYEALAGC